MEGRENTVNWQHQTMTRLYRGIMKSRTRIAPFGVALLALLAPCRGVAQTDDWKFDLSLYGVAAGLSGNVVVRGVPADVDVGFGDILRNLQMGAMGRIGVHHKRVGVAVDVIYMGLGAVKNDIDVGTDLWAVLPTVDFHVNQRFDIYGGARYNNYNATIRGPMGRTGGDAQVWWDPVV